LQNNKNLPLDKFFALLSSNEEQMQVILFIIICTVGISLIYKRYLNLTHWNSKYWNSKTKKFYNPWKSNQRIMTLKVLWEFIKAPTTKWPKSVPVHSHPIANKSKKLKITNIGHATFLIQMAELNIITDPVFSKRAGPLRLLGPKRVSAPGIPLESLPPIDIAFISHNHYDHLDKASVLHLAAFHNVTFIVPLGIKKQLLKWKIQRPIIELDWWQSYKTKDTKITATPAQHWSRRGLFDTNKTLWMSGIFESSHGSVFFAGDTGFGSHFSDIANRFPHINIGLLPIGSYKPRSVMKDHHMGPKDALNAHHDLKTDFIIPIHYDVFPLGKEGFLEAEHELTTEAKVLGVPKNQIQILKVGQSFVLDDHITSET
jgi:L-ascorbate metabolism protein UlaG (beta-lactamase superfamily)